VVSSVLYKDLVALYGWLLSLSLTIGPLTFASLFFRIRPIVAGLVLILNCAIFVGAAALGKVSIDNSYIIAIPSTALLLIFGVLQKSKRSANAPM
jgi:hypothetical protein